MGAHDGSVVVTGFAQQELTLAGKPVSGAGTFIAKLDGVTGSAVWIRLVTGDVNINGVAHDAKGDIVVAGWFQGTSDFGKGAVTPTASDAFIVKYRGSDGGFVWQRTIGGSQFDNINTLALDTSGNAYVGGSFTEVIDFGAGGVSGYESDSMFVAKYAASDGGYLWARTWGNGGYSHVTGIDVDSAGNAWAAGDFTDTVYFDGTSLNGGNSGGCLAPQAGQLRRQGPGWPRSSAAARPTSAAPSRWTGTTTSSCWPCTTAQTPTSGAPTCLALAATPP